MFLKAFNLHWKWMRLLKRDINKECWCRIEWGSISVNKELLYTCDIDTRCLSASILPLDLNEYSFFWSEIYSECLVLCVLFGDTRGGAREVWQGKSLGFSRWIFIFDIKWHKIEPNPENLINWQTDIENYTTRPPNIAVVIHTREMSSNNPKIKIKSSTNHVELMSNASFVRIIKWQLTYIEICTQNMRS